jgi:SulP family sulfate permease
MAAPAGKSPSIRHEIPVHGGAEAYMNPSLTRWFPILDWARRYDRHVFVQDLAAASVVTLLLIPQALAYATLAGMPAITGLYASMWPLVAYALMGTSPVLAVGPAALRAIMSLAAVGAVASAGTPAFVAASALLALLVGAMLLAMGALRMGFVASFLSHPVLAGFVTASGLLIGMSQLPHILGMPLSSGNAVAFVHDLWRHHDRVHGLTLAVGLGAIALLWAARRWLAPLLRAIGLPGATAALLAKAAPLLVMALAIVVTAGAGWEAHGLAVIGPIPSGLPSATAIAMTGVGADTLRQLLLPAMLIAVLTFVEQVSIAQGMAARRRERIDTNAEMRAMGAANLAAGLTGSFGVGASFSRTVVSAESGAATPAAGLLTAVLIAATSLILAPWLGHLPLAVLAASILLALGSLFDFASFVRTWRFSRADFAAQALTFATTLLVDLVSGLTVGVVASLALHIWQNSRPHIAEVGNVPGTEHYRNVRRHAVLTHPAILSLRVDGSLFFANVHQLENRIAAELAARPQLRHLVLLCSAVNDIDASALESLRTIQQRLADAGVDLHLSEVKGPVMDRLQRSDFLQHLTGRVFLTHHQAVQALAGAPDAGDVRPAPTDG